MQQKLVKIFLNSSILHDSNTHTLQDCGPLPVKCSKMSVFKFDRRLGSGDCDERGRIVYKVKSDTEWTILCVLHCENGNIWNTVDSIEIHRKNTTGMFSVIGQLTFKKDRRNGRTVLQRNIAVLIENLSSFKVIWSNLNINLLVPHRISGSLKISKFEEEEPANLTREESEERILHNCFKELSKDFETLLNPESSSADVTLECENVSIPAHKNILSARSTVFASMFAHPMLESLPNEVKISDINVSMLQTLLVYIYTGRTPELTASSSANLLFAADKYQLQGLEAVCIYSLKESATHENIWEIFALGDMHSEDLKAFAMDYIRKMSVDFFDFKNTPEWKAFQKERPDLAMDLLKSLE